MAAVEEALGSLSLNQQDELARLSGAAFSPSELGLDFGMGREEAAGRLLNQFVANPVQVAPFVGGSLIPPESPITTLPANVTDLNVPTPVQPVEETQPIWERALKRIAEAFIPEAEGAEESRSFVRDAARSFISGINPMEPTEEKWTWDDPKLVDALMMHKRATTVSALPKFLNLTEDRLIDPLNAKIKQDLNLSGDDYDALVHLAGASGGVNDLTLRGYGAVDRMIGGDDVDETIKDEINNLVGREYKGLVGTVDPATGKQITLKTIFDDSRVVKDTATLSALSELAETDPTVVERYSGMNPNLIDIATQVESFSGIPEVFDDPRVVADVEDFSAIRNRAAESARERDREAQEKADERDRKAEKAASDRARAASAKATERAAEASRKAEAKRVADTEKRAAEQRAALDAASQKALQNHMAWMATQAAKRAEEERLRALRGYGSGDMWT